MQPVKAQQRTSLNVDISKAVGLAIQSSPLSHRENDRVEITQLISSVLGLTKESDYAKAETTLTQPRVST